MAFIIGYFVVAFLGIAMAVGSDSPIVSFIGYNLVVIPVGAVLSVGLQGYAGFDILLAFLATAAVTLIMMILGTIYPKFFNGLGGTLFWSLLISLIVEIILLLFGIELTILNWIFVIIFSLYIGYDWHKAQSYAKTVDNAIDSALDLYLDIINLFIGLLGSNDD